MGATGVCHVLCGNLADGPSSAAGPLAVMLGGLILLGYFYELTATNAALLAISLAAAAGWLPTPLAQASSGVASGLCDCERPRAGAAGDRRRLGRRDRPGRSLRLISPPNSTHAGVFCTLRR